MCSRVSLVIASATVLSVGFTPTIVLAASQFPRQLGQNEKTNFQKLPLKFKRPLLRQIGYKKTKVQKCRQLLSQASAAESQVVLFKTKKNYLTRKHSQLLPSGDTIASAYRALKETLRSNFRLEYFKKLAKIYPV